MSKNRQHARKDVIPAVRIFTQSLQGINEIQSENRKRESDETIKLDKESVVETGNMYRQHQQQSHSLSIKGVVCNDLPPRFQKLYWPTDRSSRTGSDESSRQMHSSRKKSNDIFYKSASGKRRNQNNGSVVSRKNWNGTYQWKARESDQVVKDAKTDSGYCDREDWDSELMDVSNAGVVPMFPNVSREGSDLLDQSWNSICNEQSDGKSSVKMDQIQPCKYSSLGNGAEHDGDKLYRLGFMRKPDNTRHNPGSRFQKRFTEQNNSSCTNRNNPKLETVADVARVHEDWDAEITTIPESDWSLNFFENLCTDTPRQSYQVSSQGHSSKEICSIGHELNKELTSSDLYLRGESNDAPCMRSVSSTTEQEFSDAIKSNGMYKDKKIQKSSVVFEGVSNKKSDFKIGVTSKEGNESHGEINQTCLNFNEIDMSAKMSACKIFDIVENVLNEDKNSPAIMSAYREHENCPFGGKTTNLICSNLQRTHSCCGSVLTGEKGEKSLFPKNLNKSINSQKCNVVNPDMLLPSTKLFENYFESCERSIGINESNMGHFVNGKLDIKNVEDNVGLKDSTNGEKKIRHSSAVYSDMASMREFFPLEASLEEFSNSCPNQQDSSHWETASEDVLTVFDNGFYETEHLPGEPKVDGCSKLFVPDSVQVQKCEHAEGNHSRLQSVTEDLDEVMKTVCAMENEHLLLTNRLDQNPSSHMLNSTNEIRTISRENTNSKLTGSKKSIVKKTKMDKLNVCMSQSEHQTETCHQNVSVEKCIYDYNNSSFVQTTNMTSSSFSNTGISNTYSSDNETTGKFSGVINSRTVPGESIGKNSEEADEKYKPQSPQKMASNHEEECSNFEKIEDNRFNYVGGMSAFDNKFPALLSQRTSCMHTPYYLRGVAQDGVGSDFSNQPHQKQTNTGKICRESCLDSEKTDTKNAVYPLQNKNNLIVDKSTVAISDKKDTFPSGMYFQYLNAYENVMALNSMQERRGESDADWMHLISSDISMEQQAEEVYGSQQMKMKRQSNRLLGIGRGRGSVVHSFPKSEKENYGSNIDVKKTVCQPLAFTHHSTMLSGIDGHRKDGLDLTSENVPFKSRFPMHYSRDTKLETNRNNEIDLHLLTSDGIKKFACRSYEGKVHEKEKGFSSTNCNSVDGYEMETPKIIDCRKPDDALHYKKGQTHLDQFGERYVIPQRRGSEKYTDYVKDGSDVKEITCSVRKLGPMTAGGQSQAYENERLNFHDEARLVKEGKQNRYFSNASYGDSMQYSHSSRHNEPPFDNVATPLVPRANNDAELYISMESHINLKDDLDQIPKKIDCEAGK